MLCLMVTKTSGSIHRFSSHGPEIDPWETPQVILEVLKILWLVATKRQTSCNEIVCFRQDVEKKNTCTLRHLLPMLQ